jgi:hypothetical protein
MNETFSDHRGQDLDRWFDAYSTGDPVGKGEIFSAISSALTPLFAGYRYIRTKSCFHLPDDTADHYVTLERGKGILSLRFGVTHHAVEQARLALFGPRSVQVRHIPLTVSMYTANMGPHSRGWYLPYRVEWPIFGSEGLSLAIPEVCAFVEETVLPCLANHRSPEAIRDTYLLTPRHADIYLLSEQIVFAVDHMLGCTERLEADRDVLLAQRGAPDDRRRVEEAFFSVRRAHNAVRADRTLTHPAD